MRPRMLLFTGIAAAAALQHLFPPRISENDAEIFVWDGARTFNLTQDPFNDWSEKWSDDGRLAWIGADSEESSMIYVWNGKQVIEIASIPGERTPPLEWSPVMR